MLDSMPIVTVVVTTYKREPEMVERAINSVIKQTYSNIEVIVVDDSPETFELRDKVKKSVEAYKNVIYIQHEQNRGACVARNTGLKYAKGKYIAYLDDDDEWMPTKIEKQIKCFENEDVALVYCGRKICYDNRNIIVDIPCKEYEGEIYIKLLEEGNFVGSTSFVLMKKKCLEEVGGFDPLMESAQDADVWLRLTKKYKASYVKDALVIYHVHEGERITSNYTKKINGITKLIEKNIECIEANNQIYTRYCHELAILYAANNQIKDALRKWMFSARKCPKKWDKHCACLYRIFLEYISINMKKRRGKLC